MGVPVFLAVIAGFHDYTFERIVMGMAPAAGRFGNFSTVDGRWFGGRVEMRVSTGEAHQVPVGCFIVPIAFDPDLGRDTGGQNLEAPHKMFGLGIFRKIMTDAID
jgi:hypothetical protein